MKTKMKTEAIKARIDELTATLRRHSHLYYDLDTPEIDDLEYDKLQRELKNLEEQYPEFAHADSPTKTCRRFCIVKIFTRSSLCENGKLARCVQL